MPADLLAAFGGAFTRGLLGAPLSRREEVEHVAPGNARPIARAEGQGRPPPASVASAPAPTSTPPPAHTDGDSYERLCLAWGSPHAGAWLGGAGE